MSANGYLAPSELTNIGNGLSLRDDAATSFLAMAAAAQADGVQINWPGIASAYRPWAMQLDMRVHPALYGINPNMHALPGLPSTHGTGLARDVPFGAPNNWMIANAGRFGWKRPARTLKLNDLNHWEFDPAAVTASLDATPIIQQKEVPEMSRPVIIANTEKPGIFHVVSVPEGWQQLDTGDLGNAELRGLTKIIEAITKGDVRVDLTGQEIDATRGLLSSPVEK